jgi:hypothetical protein
MLDKKRGYAFDRPFYVVDANVNIYAGMVAFLVDVNGVVTATTAASGTVPCGTFWKDHAQTYIRTTVETGTFDSNDQIALAHAPVLSTGDIKVTNAAGTVVYTQGVDYSVAITNGVVTRLGGGAIAASASVVIWYKYTIATAQAYWDNASTKWTPVGYNYDRQPDDTMGSGKITIAEHDAQLYTDQYDVNQTYTLNAALYSDVNSLWTTAAGYTSACGRVLKVPTATDPFLGVQQITVVA